jgi:hypothetical protein
MTDEAVKQVITKISSDQAFQKAFKTNPEETLRNSGYALDQNEIVALTKLKGEDLIVKETDLSLAFYAAAVQVKETSGLYRKIENQLPTNGDTIFGKKDEKAQLAEINTHYVRQREQETVETADNVSNTAKRLLELTDELQDCVKDLLEKLNSVGDDAQLANIDIQNALQKQQQLIQMLSNVSKMLSDAALAAVRKIG